MLNKNERLNQYGITSDIQVLVGIEWVCDVFGNGSNNNAKLLLEKTIRHESKLGNYKDSSKEYGESVAQSYYQSIEKHDHYFIYILDFH